MRAGFPCETGTVRFFNTAGPIIPTKHYCVPALARIDVDHLLRLIGQ